ncbi:hypothetical protein ACLB2K_056996 [Fragaria x ananassa]
MIALLPSLDAITIKLNAKVIVEEGLTLEKMQKLEEVQSRIQNLSSSSLPARRSSRSMEPLIGTNKNNEAIGAAEVDLSRRPHFNIVADVRTSARLLKCGRPSFRHRTAPARARLHPSGLQQLPRPLFIPDKSAEFQFPARLTLFEVLGDLAEKLEFGGLAGEGKWSGKLLESAGVEARPRRHRTVANGGKSAP